MDNIFMFPIIGTIQTENDSSKQKTTEHCITSYHNGQCHQGVPRKCKHCHKARNSIIIKYCLKWRISVKRVQFLPIIFQQMQVMEKRGKPCGSRNRLKAKDYSRASKYKTRDEEKSFELYNAFEMDY